MKAFVSISEAVWYSRNSRKIGRRWDKAGKISYSRTPCNHCRLTIIVIYRIVIEKENVLKINRKQTVENCSVKRNWWTV